ncbi:MAG: glycosyltransferase [Allorhizobium sp.]
MTQQAARSLPFRALRRAVRLVARLIAHWRPASAKRLAELTSEVAALRGELKDRLFTVEMLLTTISPVAEAPAGTKANTCDGEQPYVSVIMPTYNRSRLLLEAANSVRKQTFENWELLIIDDGSSDDTAQAVRSLSHDPRIRYIRQENQGECAARNAGLAASRGEIIAYLDDDNLWFPHFLQVAASAFASDPDLHLAYGAIAHADPPHNVTPFMWKAFDRDALLKQNYIDTNVIVHRRSLFVDMGGWDDQAPGMADWELMLRYSSTTQPRPLPVLAALYREGAENRLSTAKATRYTYDYIQRKWASRSDR